MAKQSKGQPGGAERIFRWEQAMWCSFKLITDCFFYKAISNNSL